MGITFAHGASDRLFIVKLLFVINGLGTGGAERSLGEYAPWLVAQGVTVCIACLHRRTEGVENQVAAAGVDVRWAPRSGRYNHLRWLFRLIGESKPDLVHTTIFEADVLGRIAAAARRTRVTGSLVNMSYGDERKYDPNVSPVKLASARWLDGATARRASRLHAITHAVKQDSASRLRYPVDRIDVVYRGRDPARLRQPSPDLRESVRTLLGLPADAFLFLNVARMEFQKNQALLVEAFRGVLLAVPNAYLLIAGRAGNASSTVRQAIGEFGLTDRVILLGHRDDAPELMAASDVFVFPSRYEGLGCSVIEAMGSQLPVVCSDLPPLREVMADHGAGVLVDPAQPGAFAEAMIDFAEDPARRRQMGDAGRRAYLKRFTLDASAAGMLSFFERAMQSA